MPSLGLFGITKVDLISCGAGALVGLAGAALTMSGAMVSVPNRARQYPVEVIILLVVGLNEGDDFQMEGKFISVIAARGPGWFEI